MKGDRERGVSNTKSLPRIKSKNHGKSETKAKTTQNEGTWKMFNSVVFRVRFPSRAGAQVVIDEQRVGRFMHVQTSSPSSSPHSLQLQHTARCVTTAHHPPSGTRHNLRGGFRLSRVPAGPRHGPCWVPGRRQQVCGASSSTGVLAREGPRGCMPCAGAHSASSTEQERPCEPALPPQTRSLLPHAAGWAEVSSSQAAGLRSLRPSSSSWEAGHAGLVICLSSLAH